MERERERELEREQELEREREQEQEQEQEQERELIRKDHPMNTINDIWLGIFIDLTLWMMICIGLLGFLAVCYEVWRNRAHTRRRKQEWQRMPTLEVKPNLKLHKVL